MEVLINSEETTDETPLLSQDEEENQNMLSDSDQPKFKAQYIAAFSATLGAFAMGTVLGYSSPAGAILAKNTTDPSVQLTPIQISWFSSICNVGALLGCFFGGFSINKFGRKGTMIYTVIPMLAGWMLIILARNFAMLIVGRVITGFAAGLISIAVPTYVAEISSPQIRGVLGSGFQLMVVTGVLFAFSLGAATDSFRVIGGACSVVPLVFGLLMFFNRESPTHLLAMHKDQEAFRSLEVFRGSDFPGLHQEMNMLRECLEGSRERVSFKDLGLPHIRRPLFMSLLLFIFQQLSGINSVLFNLETIFAEAGTSMSETVNSIIVGAMQVVGTLAGAALMDRAGRKILLGASALVMTLSLGALGGFFFLKSKEPGEAAGISWVPLASLVLFIVSFSIGYGPIPWLMMGELFSPEIKELASSIAASVNWTLAFLTTLLFVPLQGAIHDYGVYWTFSLLCLVNLLYVVTVVVETKGKTLAEINAYFGAFRHPSVSQNV